MARPRIFKDAEQKYVAAEKKVWEFFDMNKGIKPGQALEEWIKAQLPRDQSAADYRIVQIEKERKTLKEDYDLQIKLLTDALNHSLKELDIEKNLLLQRKCDDEDLIHHLWPQWRKDNPLMREPNLLWVRNRDNCKWWTDHGLPLTFEELYGLWPKMEKSE